VRVALLCDQTWETAARLVSVFRKRGHDPALDPAWRELDGIDLALVRGAYWEPRLRALLTKALLLDAQGVPFFNPLPTLLRADDKAVSSEILRMAGVRVPATWVVQPGEPVPRRAGSLVIKPVQGGKQIGVEVFHDPSTAQEYVDSRASVQVVQERIVGRYWRAVATAERVVRVYAMPSDARGVTALPPGQPREVVEEYPDSLESVAPATVRALGGVMMGIDVIEDRDGRLWVLEANVAFGFNVGDDDVERTLVDECERCAGLGRLTSSRALREMR
jgi:glutathione synthase/RimK-type ligase-like ATP-grasp enzyme